MLTTLQCSALLTGLFLVGNRCWTEGTAHARFCCCGSDTELVGSTRRNSRQSETMAEEVRHIFGNSTFFHGLLPLMGLLWSVGTGGYFIFSRMITCHLELDLP